MGVAVAVRKKFSSLHEFANWISENPVISGFPEISKECGDADFFGTEDYETADALMRDGWDAGAADVKKIMLDRCDGYESVRRLALSVVGVVPCIPAYMANSPKNMIAIRRRNVPRPVVTICYNCAVSAAASADDIKLTAAKLLNVVRGLEAGGVGVDLWACSFSQSVSGNESAAMAVRIKSSSEPFNVLNMSYPLIHPSFNRRHKFAFIERCGVSSRLWANGYGRVINDPGKMAEMAAEIGINNAVCFSFQILENKSESEIAAMIK